MNLNVICTSCLEVNKIPKKETYKKALCGSCKKSLLDNKIIELNEYNFDSVIVNSDNIVIVDFYAPWCGPCKSFAPLYEQSSKNYALKVLFTKVNTQEETNLAHKFNIKSIPTLIIYKSGIEINRVNGALDKDSLNNLINQHI